MAWQSKRRFGDTRIYKYSDDLFRVVYFKSGLAVKGYEDDDSGYKRSSPPGGGDRLDNNLIRAKSRVRELALCNDFDWFVTFTLDGSKHDRYDLAAFKKEMAQFIRNQRRLKGGEWRYLLIPEQHQDGAWHMHGLMGGLPDGVVRTNANGYAELVPMAKKFGFTSLSAVKDKRRVASYITKYLTKDFGAGSEKNKHLFFSSQGLKGKELVSEGALCGDFHFDYENDWICSRWLTEKETANLPIKE